MSEQRKTVNDIYDIAMAFITDSESDVNMQYTDFGTTYCIIRRGLADFPYMMEISKSGRNNAIIALYRGTGFNLHNNRTLFKVILTQHNMYPKKKQIAARFTKISGATQQRKQKILTTANNTELLKNMLKKLSEKSK